MSNLLELPIGVTVTREATEHSWNGTRWRAHRVFLDVQRGTGLETFPVHLSTGAQSIPAGAQVAAVVPLTLHAKDVAAYCANISNGTPTVYVVLREGETTHPQPPVLVKHVSVSPFEVHGYRSTGIHVVDGVPMPDDLLRIVQAFVERHAYVKRAANGANGLNGDCAIGKLKPASLAQRLEDQAPLFDAGYFLSSTGPIAKN